jgi:hypothetical protein
VLRVAGHRLRIADLGLRIDLVDWVTKLIELVGLIGLTKFIYLDCGVRGCTAEGALRFKGTSFEARFFGTRRFLPPRRKNGIFDNRSAL